MSVALPEAPTQTRRLAVAQLLTDLEALGSPEAIALRIAQAGIKAWPCNAGVCALALYLQRYSGEFDINVGTDDLVVWRSGETPDERHTLGPVVREFVVRFDSLAYPDLVEPDFLEAENVA